MMEIQPFGMAGWWCNVPILKNDGVRQWLADDIPYIMENKNMFQSTNQYMNQIPCNFLGSVELTWDDDIPFPTEWKVIKFHGSKPPTRYDKDLSASNNGD